MEKKRYIRLDIEYDFNDSALYMVSHNIERILLEDMPYCKIIFSRDTSNRDDLDKERYKGGKEQ